MANNKIIKGENTNGATGAAGTGANNKPIACCCYMSEFGRKILMTLAGVLLVYLIFYLGTVISNNLREYKYIGQVDRSEKTITITGYGKITGSNDIAVTTLGYSNTDKDVSKAQADNKKVMDAVLSELKKLSIEDKDLQSSYSIYPDYDYSSDKGTTLKGYKVTHTVQVKIRDLTKVQSVLALAGKYGANQISGLNFTVDDTENLKAQARAKALADAKKKLALINSSLGVRAVSVVSYSESEGGGVYPMPMYAEGMGGSGDLKTLPVVSSGSSDIEMYVYITYEVK